MTASLPSRPHPGLRSEISLWFMRHGEVHPDWQGRAYGGLDVPLSDLGLAQTEERAREFGSVPFRAVLSSPLVRARTLGESLARASAAPLVLSDGLKEIERGSWAGLPIAELYRTRPDEVSAFFRDPWNTRPPGGENDRDVFERAWPPLERTLREHGGPLAITCHYNVIRILVAYLVGIPPEHSFRLRIDLSSACLVRDGSRGWKLERTNVRTARPRGAA